MRGSGVRAGAGAWSVRFGLGIFEGHGRMIHWVGIGRARFARCVNPSSLWSWSSAARPIACL